MGYSKQAGTEPIPGYRLLEPLGRGGFGEVWKCEAPGGLKKAIKFVHGNLNGLDPASTAQQEFAALERVKAIRHPFVLSLERVEVIHGELVMVMELADRNLEDRLRECQAQGLPGIPRGELLPLLREAAEALDLLNFQHGLQHLDIKPGNLFLVGNHLKLADFGLVQELEDITKTRPGQMGLGMTPLYSPPETLAGKGSPHCDQYSLAIVYQQLLTGVLPFDGKNVRQLMMQHLMAEPNLTPLPEADRPIVGKALAKKPEERFGSCQEFIRALIHAGSAPAEAPGIKKSSRFIRILPQQPSAAAPVLPSLPLRDDGATPAGFPQNPYQNTPPVKKTLAFTPLRGPAQGGSAAAHRESLVTEPPRIPGCKIVERLQAGMLGELWKVRSDNNQLLLAWTLPRVGGVREALEQYEQVLAEMEHPALPDQQVVETEDGRWALLLQDRFPLLFDQFRACVASGQAGLPRKELLSVIARTARALDELVEKHGIPHLHLNPQSLMVGDEHLLFTDFGLATVFWQALERPWAGLNPRYIAPELLDGVVTPTSDQYSLALIYAEMLTGFHPRPKPLVAKVRGALRLDLTFLPTDEQDLLHRALDPDPARRYASCMEFAEALGVRFRQHARRTRDLPPALWLAQLSGRTPAGPLPDAAEYFQEIVRRVAASPDPKFQKVSDLPRLGEDAQQENLPLRMPEGALRERLQALAAEWQAVLQIPERNVYVFRVRHKSSFWRRLSGGECGVELRVAARLSPTAPTLLSSATLQMQTYGRVSAAQKADLEAQGREMLEVLRACLQANERREHVRIAFPQALTAFPVLPDGRIAGPVAAEGKDISLGGVGFFASEEITAKHVYLQLEPAGRGGDAVLVLFKVRYCRFVGGRYETGVKLAVQPAALAEASSPAAAEAYD